MNPSISSPSPRRAVGLSRRAFLQAAAAGVTVAALPARFADVAAARTGPRSLVCVFLAGGADTFNMYVPNDHSSIDQTYDTYRSTRGAFAVPRASLLPIGDGSFGLHPSLSGLARIAESSSNSLAVVSNVGPLAAPITKADYRADRNVPESLFAHDAQQKLWQTARSTVTTDRGWGASIQQAVSDAGGGTGDGADVGGGGVGGVSPSFSIAGSNIWQVAGGSTYARLSPSTPIKRLAGYDASQRSWVPSFAGVESVMGASIAAAAASSSRLDQVAARTIEQSIATTESLESATQASAGNEVGMDDVGGNRLGMQLEVVARLIKNRSALDMNRQIFFVKMGGWDTHRNQVAVFPRLLGELDTALASFQSSMNAMGVADSVTTFTATDFGRTLTINGDGTDHGWGGHGFVFGGAVRSGDHGTVPSYSTRNNPDDVGGRSDDFAGRLIPTTSVSQYGATLARWMGLDDTQLDAAFPDLANFERRDLGIF